MAAAVATLDIDSSMISSDDGHDKDAKLDDSTSDDAGMEDVDKSSAEESATEESMLKSDEDEGVQEKTANTSTDSPSPAKDTKRGKSGAGAKKGSGRRSKQSPTKDSDKNSAERVKSSSGRERKQVERFVAPERTPAKKTELAVGVPGRGLKFSEIPYIFENIGKKPAADLGHFHHLCFGRKGKTTEIKKNLRTFSGFPFDDDSSDFQKRKATISKWSITVMKELCTVVGIKQDKKENMVDNLLAFCLQPEDTGRTPKSKLKSKSKSRRSSTAKKDGKKGTLRKSKPKDSKPAKSAGGGKKRKNEDSDAEKEGKDNGHTKSESDDDFVEPQKKRAREAVSRKANDGKKYAETDSEDEISDADSENEKKEKSQAKKVVQKPKEKSDDDDSDSDSGKKKKSPVKKAPQKSKPKPPTKVQKSRKIESESDDDDVEEKQSSRHDESSDSDDDESDFNKVSDKGLKKAVKKIVEKADLSTVNMKMVLEEVKKKYHLEELDREKRDLIRIYVDEILE